MPCVSRTLKLVTFDATNTLIKVKKSVGHKYYLMAEMYGLVQAHEKDEFIGKFNYHFTVCMREMKKKYPMYGLNNGLNNSTWWHQLTQEVFIKSGFSSPSYKKQLNIISSHLYKMFSTSQPYECLHGAIGFLRQFKKYYPNIQFGIISNSDERLVQVLSELRLIHFFNFIVLPHLDRVEKPSPAAFEFALNKASLNEPSEALHIGDSVEKDYLAAKKCGWNALLVCLQEDADNSHNEGVDERVDKNDVVRDYQSILVHPVLASNKLSS